MNKQEKEMVKSIRVYLAKAWEEGYRQAKAEGHGIGMGAYGGACHVNPYKDEE